MYLDIIGKSEVKVGRAGGVIVYVRIRLYRFHVRNLISIAQYVWCKVMVDKGNVLTIGVCYKSPNPDD